MSPAIIESHNISYEQQLAPIQNYYVDQHILWLEISNNVYRDQQPTCMDADDRT